MRNPSDRGGSPANAGSSVNTVIWSVAVVALAALTLWHFEVWPLGFERTPTGTVAAPPPPAEDDAFSPTPIAVAELPPAEVAAPAARPASREPNPLPPPAALASLTFADSFPAVPANPPPDFAEPAPAPDAPPRAASGTRPAAADGTPSAGLTGADFATAGAFGQPRALPRAMPAAPAPAIVPSSNEQPAASETATIDARLAAVDADLVAGRVLAAHKELSRLYWDEPTLRPAIAGRIDGTAKSIYFDPQPHYMPGYEVRAGDQLRLIARRYDVPWEYLGRVNGVDPQRVRAGETLKVVKGPFSAVIDLSDFTLTVHAHGYYVRRYPVGVGQDGTTPVGTFHVLLKEANPKYWGPDGVTMERDDPANPLGERWLGLDDGAGRQTSYGIHGTVDPASIGKAASRGCVRLRNEDVAEVYDLLGVGSEVVIQR